MRLLNAKTKKFCEFLGEIPDYAILSHTWAVDNAEEVVFSDMRDLKEARAKRGWRKIEYSCDQALKDGLEWVWIDTCCIDKASSAELTEAINSMFRWYSYSRVCYVYLSDARGVSSQSSQEGIRSALWHCRWFERAWTLQELLAPNHVHFFDATWTFVGTKATLRDIISQLANIDEEALYYWKRDTFCASQIMHWAYSRRSTREEDRAYSLMGLFGVNMPIIYGEGRNALRRLQEHILKNSTDHTIFAHDGKECLIPYFFQYHSFPPSVPVRYQDYADATELKSVTDFSSTITPQGVKMSVHIMKRATYGRDGKGCTHLAILRCSPTKLPDEFYALPLHYLRGNEYYRINGWLQTVDVTEVQNCPFEEICITTEPEKDMESPVIHIESLDDEALTSRGFTTLDRAIWSYSPRQVWLYKRDDCAISVMMSKHHDLFYCDLELLNPSISIWGLRYSYEPGGSRHERLTSRLYIASISLPNNEGRIKLRVSGNGGVKVQFTFEDDDTSGALIPGPNTGVQRRLYASGEGQSIGGSSLKSGDEGLYGSTGDGELGGEPVSTFLHPIPSNTHRGADSRSNFCPQPS